MPSRITGTYSANDGGSYYVRFVGDERGGQLFWFGEHPDNGAWTNVMVGALSVFEGDRFVVSGGRWWDVPKGGGRGASNAAHPETELNLLIEGNTIAKSFGSGGRFGGSRWTRIGTRPLRRGINLSGFSGEGVTGVWHGNVSGVYYVRQTGTDVVWFGEGCAAPGEAASFANVFVGSLSGSSVTGMWADVPYGATLGAGNLNLRIEGDRMVRTSGGGLNSSWTRSRILPETEISGLHVTVSTASSISDGRRPDDLRRGSVAYGVVELGGGRTLPKVSLNQGQVLNPGESKTSIINLPQGTRRRDLVSFILEHDGAPRNVFDSYDNWDVGTVEIAFSVRGLTSPCPGVLAKVSGQPFVRLTGEKTSQRISIPTPL